MDPTATSALRLGFAGECDEVAKPRNGERKQKQQNEEETRKEIEEKSRKKNRERGETDRHTRIEPEISLKKKI
jgi:hypothetical protein